MKKAIVTACYGKDYEAMGAVTLPLIRRYAKSVGAEFIQISERKFPENPAFFEKFQLFDILTKFDRVIWMDSDILVRDDCPDLFGLVPREQVGAFDEGAFIPDRVMVMRQAFQFYGFKPPKDWKGSYYNTGILVASRMHRFLFDPRDVKLGFECDQGEQTLINCRALERKFKFTGLDYRLNRMSCMDKFVGLPRHDAHIIHYAGAPNKETATGLMLGDLKKWNEDSPDYSYDRHVFLQVPGGLGDQISVEPVVRELIRQYSVDSQIDVTTHWPEIFRHVVSEKVRVHRAGEFRGEPDTPYYQMKTLTSPDEGDGSWQFMSHTLTHPIDFASLMTMHGTIKDEDKQIKLQVDNEDILRLEETAFEDIHNRVLVHPGKGWTTKTFSTDWWSSVVDELLNNGSEVALIGNYLNDKQGLVLDADYEVPDGVLDLRNMLDLRTLFAACSLAAGLLSNDSAPIHIAGAFKGWIFLVATCKAPHLLLPFRYGSQEYRTTVFHGERKMWEDFDTRPCVASKKTIDVFPEGYTMDDYIPSPEDVAIGVSGTIEDMLDALSE